MTTTKLTTAPAQTVRAAAGNLPAGRLGWCANEVTCPAAFLLLGLPDHGATVCADCGHVLLVAGEW